MTSEEFSWFRRAAEAFELTPVQAEQPTLRDQFAMAALASLGPVCAPTDTPRDFALAAYAIADAMMEARKL